MKVLAFLISIFFSSFLIAQCDSDINKDGNVDASDLLIFISNYGTNCPPPPLDIIPLWNNFYNHAPFPSLSFANLTQIANNDTLNWNDIKDIAQTYWIMTATQDTVYIGAEMNFGDAAIAGMCEGNFMLSLSIHYEGYVYTNSMPSRVIFDWDVYEECDNSIDLFSVNQAGYIFGFTHLFAPYSFCDNCN